MARRDRGRHQAHPQLRKGTEQISNPCGRACLNRASARIVWAIELLEVAPTSAVHEIGCGNDVAAQLICPSVERGSYTGVDRSRTAIAATLKRNAAHIEAGRASFLQAAFDAADHAPARFDRVLGLGNVTDGLVGLCLMRTAPNARRMGLARGIARALCGWGAETGAHTAYLQVEQSNEPAVALYAAEGFRTTYRYHYWVAPT